MSVAATMADFGVSQPPPDEDDRHYAALERRVAYSAGVANNKTALFTTDADPEKLWAAYIDTVPGGRKGYYDCRCCRSFVEKYGGLVTVDEDGRTTTLLWRVTTADETHAFATASRAMTDMVEKAKVTGVFYSAEATLGTPTTPGGKKAPAKVWTHLHGVNPFAFKSRGTLSADQVWAEKRQDFGTLNHSLADYPVDVARQAVRVLEADGLLDRSEKVVERAKWFLALHEQVAGKKGKVRDNLVWVAVATAPPGWCGVRSSVLSTLLDDIKAGVPVETVARKWQEKMHPLQYRRPTAPPKEGAVLAAEKLVAELGLERSFARRYATLADVLVKLWVPAPAVETPPKAGGVFAHLLPKTPTVSAVALPAVNTTWVKFAATVLPKALKVEVKAPAVSWAYYGLVTQADQDAPPLLQWDGLVGHPRNPTAWYFYQSGPFSYERGKTAAYWGLTADAWVDCPAVFLPPPTWQEPDKFRKFGDTVFFALTGCVDKGLDNLVLFPETFRAELNSVERVVAAHSAAGRVRSPELGAANGIAFAKGAKGGVTVRVTTAAGPETHVIDRWD